jgi:hypothetical protein
MHSQVVVEPASSGASIGRTDTVRRYIAGQQAHHRKLTFPEEFLALLKAHQIEYEERYLWK